MKRILKKAATFLCLFLVTVCFESNYNARLAYAIEKTADQNRKIILNKEKSQNNVNCKKTQHSKRARQEIEGLYVTAIDQEVLLERLNSVISNMKRRPEVVNGNVAILDFGIYDTVFHANNYESHHLISSKFCKNHGININMVPCVLIPKELHKKTGSYGNSISSQEYRKKEDEIYDEKGLIGVLDFGIEDLKNTLKQCGVKESPSLDASATPVKKTKRYIELYEQYKNQKLNVDTRNDVPCTPISCKRMRRTLLKQ